MKKEISFKQKMHEQRQKEISYSAMKRREKLSENKEEK